MQRSEAVVQRGHARSIVVQGVEPVEHRRSQRLRGRGVLQQLGHDEIPAQDIGQADVGQLQFAFDDAVGDRRDFVADHHRPFGQGHFQREARILEGLLRDGLHRGELSLRGTRATAEALVTATNALLPYSLSVRELGKRRIIETRAARVIDLLIAGLRTHRPAAGSPA